MTESGFRFDLPPDRTFRLGECEAYSSELSHLNMKEMDFAWVPDVTPPVVWIVEVSNYALGPDADARYDGATFRREVVQKVTDSVWMLLAMWAKTEIGQRLCRDVTASCPTFPTSAVAIRPALLVGLGGSDASLKLHTLTSVLRPT